MIYIRITENLVLLLNDTLVKLFLSMKTSVDNSTEICHDVHVLTI